MLRATLLPLLGAATMAGLLAQQGVAAGPVRTETTSPDAAAPSAPDAAGAPAPADPPAVGVPAPPAPPAEEPKAEPAKPAVQVLPTGEAICRTIEEAAAEHGIPVAFFTRLIWQESRFKPHVVSRAGAQGIAQFMPRTADWRGLANPFNPIEALWASARLLQDLNREHGNLGLAAAAYNAGSKRVSDWRAGARSLPRETRAYVLAITGRPAEDWAQPEPPATAVPPQARGIPCANLVAALLQPIPVARPAVHHPTQGAWAPWGVQVAGAWSSAKALATYAALRRKHGSLLGSRDPLLVGGRLRTRGTATFYRVRVAVPSRQSADKLCASLKAAGTACVVLRNSGGPRT